jgi:hypothetical protein
MPSSPPTIPGGGVVVEFPSDQPSVEPAGTSTCAANADNVCKYKADKDTGEIRYYTSVCVKDGDKDDYRNKCVENTKLGDRGPADTYGKYIIENCGCCDETLNADYECLVDPDLYIDCFSDEDSICEIDGDKVSVFACFLGGRTECVEPIIKIGDGNRRRLKGKGGTQPDAGEFEDCGRCDDVNI